MALRRTFPSLTGDREGKSQRRVITDEVTVLEPASGTDDAATLLEVGTPPSGGVPVHAQRYEDELFYVLEGSYSVLIGERELEMKKGDSLFIPRGTNHGYANPGPGSARMLVIVIPGGIHDQFLDEIGEHADRPVWDVDMAKVLAVAPKYGISFLSPDEA